MSDRLVRIRLIILSLLALVGLIVWTPAVSESSPQSTNLEVSFLDVGQGDATLIETPTGVQVLIDGGRSSGILRELAATLPLFDTDIDILISTHPDIDHVGGLVDVLDRYEVGRVLMTENVSDSVGYQAFARAVSQEGAEVTMARRGQTWHLDASTTLEVLFPETDASDMESNASSIVVKLTYGETSFMLTGDSPKRIEEYLVLVEGENLHSTVLKAGHHGSRTSTSELFLEEVDPEYAVISAGVDNRYGHPHVEVTDMFFNHRVKTLSTAEEGTITFVSDGEEVWVE